MPEIDLFNFFRWALFIFVSIYCTLITVQSLWGWYVWLASDDRYMTILRRYVILHGLRLRFKNVLGGCADLCAVVYRISADDVGPRPSKVDEQPVMTLGV
ncbi:MAG: hypothetical protein KatS3mg104_0631 [Phycisphaerae bacterium]|nr:MAG: hypothetical protein KatS3mg104_0631 [Phycisphaerae bacterium]